MKIRFPFLPVLFGLFLFLASQPASAAYLKYMHVTVNQPDGTELALFLTGDEYYQRLHDANDFTIVRNKLGYYVYALLENDVLVPGSIIVGQGDPRTMGIKPGLNISPEKWKQLREDFWKDTPAAKLPNQTITLNTGTVNNLAVFIRFADQTAFPSNIAYYDSMFNASAVGANSMYNYYKEASYNNITIPTTFYPTPSGTLVLSYQDTHNRAYFMPWDTLTNPTGYKSNQRTDREHTLLRAAVTAITSQVPAGLNLDYNNDGDIDNICFIIRGGTTAWSSLLWPHRWSLYTSPTVSINGKHAYDYNLQLEDFLPGSGVGVLAHEMFHTFGAPDLYHYTGNGISPAGVWDLMDANQNPPQHMSAFMKFKYGGWIASIPSISGAGTYTLNPLTSSTGNAYKITSSASATEYFVVEYRKDAGTFESSLPGSGLVVYRINTAAGNGNAGGPPDEVYAYRPGGTSVTNGTINQGFFSSGAGRTAFNDTTNPNCFLSNDSNAHINIYNIGAAGNTISFQVGMAPIANFSANILNTCPFQTINFVDYSGGTILSRTWTFSPNTVIYMNGTNASSQNPQVQFTGAGDFTVALSITTASGSNTNTKNNYIHITNPTNTPFTDNFESGSFATKAWTVTNSDAQTSWTYETAAAGNGLSTKSVWMNLYSYENLGAVDELVSPGITLPSSGTVKLKFKVAYRAYDNSYHDTLKVAIYTSCGQTLAAIPYSKTYSDLATGPDDVNAFVPTVAGDWRTDSIDLSAYVGQTIVVKIIAINGYGNNLFLDDINLSATGGVVANFTANTNNICQNGSVNFSDLSTGSPTSWAWTFGDGQTSTLQNPSHQYLTAGSKTVTLTVTKVGSTNTMSKSGYIVVVAGLSASLSISPPNPAAFCTGTQIGFTATPVNGGISPIYQWKVNNVNAGNNSPQFTYTPTNGDQVKCIMISSALCASGSPATSNTVTMAVNPALAVAVSISTSATSLCQGTAATFIASTVNGGNTPSYQWKVNNVIMGISGSGFTYVPLNGDQIKCVLTSNASCVSGNPANSNVVSMTIIPNSPASVTVTTPLTNLCIGSPVSFTAAITNGGPGPVYQWKVNNVNVGTNNAAYTFTPVNGDQVVCVLSANMVCSSNNPATSNNVALNVLPYPLVNLGNDTTIPLSDSLVLNAGSGYTAYAWNTGESGQFITIDTTGNYYVTVTNSAGCATVDSVHVTHGYSQISGSVSYLNASGTVMDSVTVSLKSGNSVIQAATTNAAGDFLFSNVLPGNYTLEAASQKYWGGSNSSDALLVLKHFVAISFLSGLKLKAANVDNSPSVNALDGLLISKRFAAAITSFAAGDWTFEKPVITFTGNSNIIQGIRALCTGDVNGSYTPFAKLQPGLELLQQGAKPMHLSEVIRIPLNATKSIELAAISMIIAYPADDYELLGVNIPSARDEHLEFTAQHGQIRLSWYSLEPLKVNEDEAVLIFSFRALKGNPVPLLLQSLAGTELADEQARPYLSQTFYYPEVQFNIEDESLQAEIFPNPNEGSFVIGMFSKESDNVSLTITNAIGECIYSDENIAMNGRCNRQIDISKEGAGVYFVLLKGQHSTISKKVVVQ